MIDSHPLTNDKWVRSPDGMIAGVCEGLSETMGVDALFLRLGFVILALLGGTGVLLYPMLWIALPKTTDLPMAREPKFLGVCSRIQKNIEMDIGLVRFIALLLSLISLGVTAIVYVILNFVLSD